MICAVVTIRDTAPCILVEQRHWLCLSPFIRLGNGNRFTYGAKHFAEINRLQTVLLRFQIRILAAVGAGEAVKRIAFRGNDEELDTLYGGPRN